jgi:hypothetical protein
MGTRKTAIHGFCMYVQLYILYVSFVIQFSARRHIKVQPVASCTKVVNMEMQQGGKNRHDMFGRWVSQNERDQV